VPVALVGGSVAPAETSETSDDEMLMVGEWQNAEGVEGERRVRPARQHPTALHLFKFVCICALHNHAWVLGGRSCGLPAVKLFVYGGVSHAGEIKTLPKPAARTPVG
jgi:hypothetical protein